MPNLNTFVTRLIILLVFSTLVNAAKAEVSIEQIYTTLNLTEDEKAKLNKGEIVKRVPKEYSNRELAVSFAFKIKEKPEQVYTFFIDTKSLESNKNIKGYKFIQSIDDFSEIKFNKQEIKDIATLINAKPGDKNNLSESEITAFQQLKESGKADKEQVVKQFKQLLADRYQSYVQKGISGIAPYRRGKKEIYNLGQFFMKINQEISPKLKELFPRFFAMSTGYPQNKPEDMYERFIFLKMNLEGRPAFALEHRISIQEQGNYLMASRYFYVNHTLNGQQQMGMLLQSDQDAVAISIVRASTDQITGFGGSSKQLIGRTMLWNELSGFYKDTKSVYEK